MDQLDLSKYAANDAPPSAPDLSKFAVKQETLPPDVIAKYAIMPTGKATVRDDADFSEEIKAQGEELARTNKPEGQAIDISRGDLLPERGVRVSIPVLPDDDAGSLLARGVHATATHLGLRGADVELATREALDYLRSNNITAAMRAGSDEPISKEELDGYKLKGVTTFDSSHPGLKPIFDRYIEAGKTGAGVGLSPSQMIVERNTRRELARMPPVMQGMMGGFYGVDHDIGNALSATGLADENFTKDADKGSRLVAQTIQEDPDQSFGANVMRGIGGAVPQANELMSFQQTGAALPIMGALHRANEGKAAALEGAVEGVAMQAGMGATSGMGLGRAGNAALWTIVPTAQGINAGKTPSKALADALPFGLMAGMEGGREAEEPLTLGRLVEHAEAAHVERAPVDARPGVVGNSDGTITVTVPAADNSGLLHVTVRPSFSKAQALRSAARMRVNLARLESGAMSEGEKQGLMEFNGVGDEKHLAQFFRDREQELKQHAFGSVAGQIASDARATNAPEGVGQAQASVPAADAPPVNDGEWQPFPPESGTLNIPRASMPQIKSEHRGAMVQFLKGRGITHSQEEVVPSTLKPSQSEFSSAKVEKARGFEGEQRSVLVSSDGHVLDGHHQWLSSLADAPHEPIPAIRLHAPAHQLLIEAARFPSSGVDEASGSTSSNGGTLGREASAQPERAPASRIKEHIYSVLSLPRSIITAGDLSASGRQGAALAAGHPVKAARAFGAQLKAFASEGRARAEMNRIKNSPMQEVREKAGLFLPDLEDLSLGVGQREEVFSSRLAKHVPLVNRSERAFNTFLNKMRADVFDDIYKAHPEMSEKELSDVARTLNVLTGRGSLGPLEGHAAEAAQILFAPRLLASRVESLTLPFRGSPVARREAARSLVSLVGANIGLLGVARMAGAKVETDPRSTDFARIRIGNTRLDLTAGYQPLIRYTAQLLTGQRKDLETGEIKKAARLSIAEHLGRTRLAPQVSIPYDLATGKNVAGEHVGAREAVMSSIEYLVLRDIREAVNDDRKHGGSGARGAALGSLAIFGVGASTFDSTKKAKGPK